MLWLLRSLPADASNVKDSTMRLSTVPFLWGPHWRKIQHQRKLLKASQAGEINRGTCSSIPSPGTLVPSCPLSSIRAGKSALSINQTHIPSPTAERPTSVGTVSSSTHLQSVILQAWSPLNLDSFQCYLACHLDRQWSQGLLQGILEKGGYWIPG